MKKTLYFLLSLIVFASFMVSCSDDDDDDNNNENSNVSTEDAAEVVATSFSEDAGGFVKQLSIAGELAAEVSGQLPTLKSALKDDPMTFAKDTIISYEGALVSWEYNLSYEYGINLVTSSIFANYTSTGSYDGPRINNETTVSAEFAISSESLLAGSDYILNGSSERNGTTIFTRGSEFSSSEEFNFDKILINKETYEISGGTITVKITLNSSTLGSAEFSGTLVIVDSTTATLDLNGNQFTIDLGTGTVTPVTK